MNKEEKEYLPMLEAALKNKNYPEDAITLIIRSPWAVHIVGDSWRNHVPIEFAQGHFERRWLMGPMRCYWLWQPGMELDKLPQDVSSRAAQTIKHTLAEIVCPSCGRHWHDPDNNVARVELCGQCKKQQPEPNKPSR